MVQNAPFDTWLHGALGLSADQSPFPWQLALLQRFCRAEVPRAIDIPTGLGKTSVMALWLVARAMGARIPRRLVYVVDRRAVVDQSTSDAARLSGFVESTADLKAALGLGSRELPISTLRGKQLDNRAWLYDPAAPAIVVGTVDMVGSRLLFEGYGVSRKMRPIHAGLLGADTLFVLDEAHLVPAFERLLQSVAAAHENGLGPERQARELVPRLQLLSLSATARDSHDALTLGPDDYAHPVVAERVRARKILELLPGVAKDKLAAALVDEAWTLAATAVEPSRIVIFCDTRNDATEVADGLRKRIGRALPESPSVELFVGGRRVHERRDAEQRLKALGFLAGSDRPSAPAFLVATSAAEVGVDLDADAAVADVVAWERMVQRLGRVNRRGRGVARVRLLPLEGEERAPERRSACLELLKQLPACDGGLDGSPAALAALRTRAETEPRIAQMLQKATTPAPLHPPLTRPLVDAWAMTSLERHTGRPEVEPWLRGWVDEEAPQTTVFFRDHLPLVGGTRLLPKQELSAFFEIAGPHASEQLDVEVFRALDWLGKRLKALAKERRVAGPESVIDLPVAIAVDKQGDARMVTATSLLDKRARQQLERALVDGWLLIDARVGGLNSGLLDPDMGPPLDANSALDLTKCNADVPFRVRRAESLDEGRSDGFRVETAFAIEHGAEGEILAWLVVERRQAGQPLTEAGRSIARRAQSLDEHQGWVEVEAAAIAEGVGLDARLARALCLAARLHDEGKRAERWQRAFHVPPNERPLAKSTHAPSRSLLGSYRHELGSLPRVEKQPEFASLDEDLRDLVLHLVASHHGRARPVLPIDDAEEPRTLLVKRQRDVALRFDRLSRRFGPWGLAWLESLLRAADQRASRRNDEASHG